VKVRWLKCAVIGTGKGEDSWRPNLDKYPGSWSAVYYPNYPKPYQYCLVRFEDSKDTAFSPEDVTELKTSEEFSDFTRNNPHFKHRWFDQLADPAGISKNNSDADPVETRYFRADTHTVNTKTYNKLLTTQSGAGGYGVQSTENDVESSIRVDYDIASIYIVHLDGSSTLIGYNAALTYLTSNSEGIQSATWVCPSTAMLATDAVQVSLRVKFPSTGYGGIWYYITEQLGASNLDAATWTLYRYSYRLYPDPYWSLYTMGRIYHDSVTYNTRITNFTWTAAASGWSGTIAGVTNPAAIAGVPVANIASVKGVASA